jgi:hypothetical protein
MSGKILPPRNHKYLIFIGFSKIAQNGIAPLPKEKLVE